MSAQQAIGPFGSTELTLAVGQAVAVSSMGSFKVYRRTGVVAYSWVEEVSASNTEVSVGPYDGVTVVRIDGGAWNTLYNQGAAAAAAETFGGAGPTLNSYVYFNHFTTYDATEWTITTTEAGAGSATEVIAAEAGGVLLITNDDADNDADFFQLKGEMFKFVAGKQLWFEIRLKTNDATETDIVAGLQITDTSPLAVSDGVYFIKNDGAATVDFVVNKNSTLTTASAVATMANNEYIILGFYYDGAGVLEYRVNREKIGTSVLTNLPDDEELTVSFGIQNGAAAAKTLSVDYIRVEAEA